jgi:DnaJ-class molecular chaperone
VTAPDPYVVLGITPSADDHELDRAFRALVRQQHPDTSPDASAAPDSERLHAVQRAHKAVHASRPAAASRTGALAPAGHPLSFI